ncbi:hypothetical protein WICPIJ_000500 [Wickerhamomyces pijperi]|uniref:Secreted protein n=1 Tax=Wickerhamomyces pijperi TaxID=599730 RepID=A0A9P8QGF7_WICPI|nr:hypothetical protein WICPIJ_000500 [Wickerhamomyces pijperi]
MLESAVLALILLSLLSNHWIVELRNSLAVLTKPWTSNLALLKPSSFVIPTLILLSNSPTLPKNLMSC